MAGLRDLEENIAKLEEANASTREVVREAHETIKTVKQLTKELKEERDRWEIGIRDVVDKAIEEQVRLGLEKYQSTIKTATESAHQHVMDEFEKLTNLMLYGNEKGKGESIIEAWVQKAIRDEMKDVLKRVREGRLN